MAYSDFTLKTVLQTFDLKHIEQQNLFVSESPVEASIFLKEALAENIPLALAIGTEKARSELIIVNVLIEIRKKLKHQISLFSGVKFDVDAERNLTGFCDFMISASPEQLFIDSPVIALVEAKNENIMAGLGQCIAEMVAAQQFNLQESNVTPVIYGIVTSGTVWKFLKLEQSQVFIDLEEYYIKDINIILEIILSMLE
ncbi:MAG: hypothetical protein Q9M50_04900 [Methylococcales bacterium]|nr:hypothetical protein [Methylococcales bacterium]